MSFRAGVELVRLAVIVGDPGGRLAIDLTRDDFTVHVDGVPVAIEVFSGERQPLAMSLLFETTYGDRLGGIRAAGHALIEALAGGDRATIGSYGEEVAQSPIVTGDRVLLHQILDEEIWVGSLGNPAMRALGLGIERIANESGKRAVVVLGADIADICRISEPCPSERQVVALARGAGVLVYGIRVGPEVRMVSKNDPFPILRLTRAIGGGYLRLEDEVDVPQAMADVLEQLRHEYLIGFAPPAPDGREHKVSVRVRRNGLITHILRAQESQVP